jgi:two-component system sensor histidine kinase/response regulator
MKKINLIYIDDEINNLHSFKAKFRNDYNIFLANNSTEAFQILTENSDIHVILSDQRMPDITGVVFFESILHTFPDPIRILLTGYSDISVVIDAINKGNVFRYLEKPWNDHEMKIAIENAFQFYFLNTQLKSKNEELKKKNEELNRFVYSAYHDLKAPLKSMEGILNLAKLDAIKEDNVLQLFDKCVRKLDYFICSITDYYKNTSVEKIVTEIHFEQIIKDSFELIQQTHNCSIKDINISTSIIQNTTFVSDEFRVHVIISYLLSNAVKYQKNESSNKELIINVVVTDQIAKLTIKDNGIGISTTHINHIFNMFYRGTSQSTGSGIGLYIVKETLDKLSGKIEVISEENEGTCFEIQIPNEYKPT